MRRFEYAPLPDPQKYIRLLRVVPQSSLSGLNPFTCELIVVPDSEQVIYRALSYTWGSETASRKIELNGCLVEVTESLYWFLHYYAKRKSCKDESKDQIIPEWRHPCYRSDDDDAGECLWIDALCIDQASKYEKNHQVELMGAIYRNAKSVVVWLGLPEDQDVANAFEFYDALARRIGRLDITTIRDRTGWSFYKTVQEPLIQSYLALLQDDVDPSSKNEVIKRYWDINHDGVSRLTKGLEKVFQHPYWGRAWVVQEVLLAKSVDIWSGDYQIRWDLFDFFTNPTNFKGSLLKLDRFRAEELMDQRRNPEYRGHLPQIIIKNKGTRCRDPRDRVFAFLSLVDEADTGPTVNVDYSIDLVELFLDLLKKSYDYGYGVEFARVLYEALEIRPVDSLPGSIPLGAGIDRGNPKSLY